MIVLPVEKILLGPGEAFGCPVKSHDDILENGIIIAGTE